MACWQHRHLASDRCFWQEAVGRMESLLAFLGTPIKTFFWMKIEQNAKGKTFWAILL